MPQIIVERVTKQRLPPHVEWLWFGRGVGVGLPAGIVLAWAVAVGWMDRLVASPAACLLIGGLAMVGGWLWRRETHTRKEQRDE